MPRTKEIRRAIGAVVALAVLAACRGPRGEGPIAIDSASVSTNATKYCRSTTCAQPADYPQGTLCAPEDWPQQCADKGQWDVPLWWSTTCVGWSLQKDASRRVSFADAEQAMTAAFATWSSAICKSGHPSIAAQEQPPVDCARASYSKTGGPNQNAIIFHDDGWPHEGGDLTIALTTTTFDYRTGEIFDADIEINEGTFDVTVGGQFDLQVVLTHETGHFLGLAHSSNTKSVMYPTDEGQDIAKRLLSKVDADGICAIYRSDGGRSVSKLVEDYGRMSPGSCDPTPHHGFTSECVD